MKNYLSVFFLLGISLFLISCTEKNTAVNSKARLEIRLTDDPAGFDAVNIDVQDIMYNINGDTTNGWKSMAGVRKGIYNLLDLVNDKDTLLADAEIPTGELQQIRLVLGAANSIVVNGVSIPLTTPSAQQSGLKLSINQEVVDGVIYKMLLDFDVAKSVVQTGNGKFILKPVIRTILEAAGGSITGVVKPDTVKTAVLGIQGLDTIASTFSGTSGNFIMKGLAPGSYDLHYIPMDTTFQKQILAGIIVTKGSVTKVDTVTLLKK